MTSDVVKNVTIELADPQNPQIDPENVPLLLLELILAQLNQWTQLEKKPRTAGIWNRLPQSSFPDTYDLGLFKSRVNKLLPTLS